MRDDLSVIYYTSNKENSVLEDNIKKDLLSKIDGLPLISVSQKPIGFGKNICVGEVGVSAQNSYRQFQVGAIEAKTKYVCPAESDMLYPKDFFDFIPNNEDTAYGAFPLYVLFAKRKCARVFASKRNTSEALMIISRDLLIKRMDQVLKDVGMWGDLDVNENTFPYFFGRSIKREIFYTSIPTITIKTDNQMHRRTPHDRTKYTRELPYWGTATELLGRLFENKEDVSKKTA